MGTGIKKERRRQATDIDEQCDRLAKALLTNPLVQAFVVNHACTEFLGLPIEEVKKRIQRHQMKQRRVDVEAPVALEKTENLEDDTKTNFDILFEAESPLGAMLRINIEVQGKYQKSSIMKGRYVYYTARLVSPQKAEGFFTGSHYDGLRKVYSIWICLNPPAHRRGRLIRYRLTMEVLEPDGTVSEELTDSEIDKICIVEICLAKDPAKQPDWMKALSVLFNTKSTPDERRKALEENGVKLTKKEEEEFMKMSSYGKYIHSQIRKEVKAEVKAEVEAEMEAKMAEKNKAAAERMLSRGFSLDDIQAITELPMDVIRSLRDKLVNAVSLQGKLTPA